MNQGARRDFTRLSTSGFLPASVDMWPGIEAQEDFGDFSEKTHSKLDSYENGT
jgi:hypothetical protein